MYECYEDPTINDSHVGEAAVSIGNAVWTACRLNVSQTPVLSGPQGAMLADTVEPLREATLWEVFRSLGHVTEGDCGIMGASFASRPQGEWLYSVTCSHPELLPRPKTMDSNSLWLEHSKQYQNKTFLFVSIWCLEYFVPVREIWWQSREGASFYRSLSVNVERD